MVVDNDIDATKSPNDKRVYRRIILPNELECLIIHSEKQHIHDDDEGEESHGQSSDDDEEDGENSDSSDHKDSDSEDDEDSDSDAECKDRRNAAAALTVGVGSFSEPRHIEGLAHYLEHMVFMGSEKYPDENGFEAFLNTHGGYSNGSTDCEQTNYYFEVGPAYLKEALDRFAQFFTTPLFREDALDRELCAIQSEFDQARQSDGVRLQELVCHTCSIPDHPFCKFTWGNTKSLKDIPQSKGINVLEEMKTFYREHYSANLMKLVVFGEDSLDEMEQWIRDSYSDIPNLKMAVPTFEHHLPPWGNEELPKIYKAVPVRHVNKLFLSWPIQNQLGLYRQRPDDTIAHLLGHEADGSILSLLKNQGLATSIYAGIADSDGYEFGTNGATLSISMKLTETGVREWESIVTIIFQYLEMLKQLKTFPSWIFDELRLISDMNFRFQEEQAPVDYTEEMASVMQMKYRVDRSDLLRYDCLQGPFEPKLVTEVLDQLIPSTLRIDLLSHSFEKDDLKWEVEPWFETRYVATNVSPEIFKIWQHPTSHSALVLPIANPFIASDFTTSSTREHQPDEPKSVPEIIAEEDYGICWHKLDDQFHVPKVNASFYLFNRKVHQSPRHKVMGELFVRLIRDSLTEVAYYASLAELQYSIGLKERGFCLKFSGFHDKLSVFAHQILQGVLHANIDARRFELIHEELLREFANVLMKPPNKARYCRLLLLVEHSVAMEEQVRILKELTLEDVVDFMTTELLAEVAIHGLIHGNMTKEDAKSLFEMVYQSFQGSSGPSRTVVPLDREDFSTYRIADITPHHLRISQPSEHREEVTNVIDCYYQIGEWNFQDEACAQVLEQIMNEPLFDTLRTKEQLGYDVHCTITLTGGILGFKLTIQSSAYTAQHVQTRLDQFLRDFPRLILEKLQPQEFQDHIHAVMTKQLERESNMEEESRNYWYEIELQRYEFHHKETLAQHVKDIKLNHLQQWYGQWVLGQKKKKDSVILEESRVCRLCVHICAAKQNKEILDEPKATSIFEGLAKTSSSIGIEDPAIHIDQIVDHRSQLQFYPNFLQSLH